jgi:hypothetical protein
MTAVFVARESHDFQNLENVDGVSAAVVSHFVAAKVS